MSAEAEGQKALLCLRLEVPKSVANDVEAKVLAWMAAERGSLREKVEAMRAVVNESLSKQFQAGKTASTVYWSEVGQEKALSEVLALLAEPGEGQP